MGSGAARDITIKDETGNIPRNGEGAIIENGELKIENLDDGCRSLSSLVSLRCPPDFCRGYLFYKVNKR